jgi:hypothetical protein
VSVAQAPPAQRAEPEPIAAERLTVEGGVMAYRLHDVGYELNLDRAFELLGPEAPARAHPARDEAKALLVKNPPLSLVLGTETLDTSIGRVTAEVSARLYDFGVLSVRLAARCGGALPWSEYAAFASSVERCALRETALSRHLEPLLGRLGPAIDRPQLAPVSEDYMILRVDRLATRDGGSVPTARLRDQDLAALVLDESRELSSFAWHDLIPHRLSYYADDLAVLAWERALVIEPDPRNADIEYVLEFANAQLLELRVYDALLDAELPRIYTRVAHARARFSHRFLRRYGQLLAEIQTRVADVTEVVERTENAFRVTDDVYLARVYSAAMDVFRGRSWRAGVDRKLEIIRQTYAMLNAESQSARAEILEVAIVVLIVAEILLASFRP